MLNPAVEVEEAGKPALFRFSAPTLSVALYPLAQRGTALQPWWRRRLAGASEQPRRSLARCSLPLPRARQGLTRSGREPERPLP